MTKKGFNWKPDKREKTRTYQRIFQYKNLSNNGHGVNFIAR